MSKDSLFKEDWRTRVLCTQALTPRGVVYSFPFAGEINMDDLSAAVASCGANLHPQILKAAKRQYDPDNSGTLDIVNFFQITKTAIMS